jgi:hypothetical protein
MLQISVTRLGGDHPIAFDPSKASAKDLFSRFYYPKTEIGIGWEAEENLVGRAGRGYKRCIAKHTL